MKRKVLLLCVWPLLMSVFCSGCWDSIDVDELGIVIGVGIDRIPSEEHILLTVQVVNPTATRGPGGAENTGQEQPFIVLTSQGSSFFEALRNLTKTAPRKLFLAHNRIVVLGKDFAVSDISEVMDYMDRDREFRRTNWILAAEKTAKEILETQMDLEKLPAQGVHTLLISKDQTAIYPINRNEFLLLLKSDVGVSYAPFLRLKDLNQESNAKLQQAGEKPPESSQTNSKAKIHLEETAIFQHNRLIGILNAEETHGLLWLINKLKGDTIVIPYASDTGEKEITLDIRKGKSRIIPHITENEITMEIICTGEAALRENQSLRTELNDLGVYKKLEQEAETIIKKQVEQSITRAQQDLKADFVGFGNHIHNANPVEWKRLKADWDQRFLKVKYDVSVQVTILNMGKIKSAATQSNSEE